MTTDRILAFIFGVVFLGILTYAGMRPIPITDEGQFFLLRIVAAVSAAATAGAIIPGLITVDLKASTLLAIRASGALAVFVLVYAVNPPKLLQPTVKVGREGDRDRAAQLPVVQALVDHHT